MTDGRTDQRARRHARWRVILSDELYGQALLHRRAAGSVHGGSKRGRALYGRANALMFAALSLDPTVARRFVDAGKHKHGRPPHAACRWGEDGMLTKLRSNMRAVDGVEHVTRRGFSRLRLKLRCGHFVERPRKYRHAGISRIEDKPPGWVYCQECAAQPPAPTR